MASAVRLMARRRFRTRLRSVVLSVVVPLFSVVTGGEVRGGLWLILWAYFSRAGKWGLGEMGVSDDWFGGKVVGIDAGSDQPICGDMNAEVPA